MRFFGVLMMAAMMFSGCDSIGLGGSYPSIYTKSDPSCGCDGAMYMLKNPNQTTQKVVLMRIRQSGTSPKNRKKVVVTIQPKVEKKLGCSEINLYIGRGSPYCDTHQSFYVKTYREIK